MFDGTWLNITQLSILGVKEHHVYFIILLLLLGLLYFIISPVIQWIISLQSAKLLGYMISSLLFLILLFILTVTSDRAAELLPMLLKISLQGFSLFGVILLLHSFIGHFIKKQS